MSLLTWLRGPAWDEVDFWAIDLETSGLEARRDIILSVGMVPIRGGAVRWGESYYSLVRPPAGAIVKEEAIRIHYLLPREVERAPPWQAVVAEMHARLRDGVQLYHHAALDLGFLRRARVSSLPAWPRRPTVDTLKLLGRLSHRRRLLDPAAEALPGELQSARAELGLPAHRAHHALFDALATAELFLVLRERLQLGYLRQIMGW